MKNIVVLQKDENGDIVCNQISEKGIEYIKVYEDQGMWQKGGTIALDELDEILDREINYDETENS